MATTLVIVHDVLVARAVERHARTLSVLPTATAARSALRSSLWDAVVVDAVLRDADGIELVAQARASGWAGVALAIADRVTEDLVNRAFDARVSLTTNPVLEARVLRFLGDATVGRQRFFVVIESWRVRYRLSVAELTNLELIARGMSQEQITLHRNISRETLKRENKNLLKKTLDDTVMQAAMRLWNEL